MTVGERAGRVGEHPVTVHPVEEGLALVDRVEGDRYTLATDRAVAPTAVDEPMLFPVDTVASVTAGTLALPGTPTAYVRDGEGSLVGQVEMGDEERVPAGEHYLEVEAPLKLYLRVTGPLTVARTTETTRVALDAPGEVLVGARSRHERPGATVRTTPDPEDLMAAVSTFGSALKTTSPERSFPTLRGHPPVVELGESLSVPDEVAPPETGVTVEVPPELRYVYPVAPLSHYLGAEVVPGEAPRLVTDAGVEHDLAPDRAFEREVERVLKGTFLLDCVVRTEGLYDLDLHERRRVEAALDRDLDLAALYDQPLAERLDTYLSVPYDALAPSVPDWKLTAYVEAEPDSVEALPFLVDDLAVVRTPAGAGDAVADAREEAAVAAQSAAVDGLLRSGSPADPPSTAPTDEVDDERTMEVAWVGDGVPRGASKATATAFRNRLDSEPAVDDVRVTVVCNDEAMAAEGEVAAAAYGGTDPAVTVERRSGLTTDELGAVLAEEASFLHYVGHVDEGGFRCPDGTLDARELTEVGVDAFLLNGCTSYHQGMALVEAGAAGGVVTLGEVVDDTAVAVGSTAARMLGNGYPLRPALEIARHVSHAAGDYVVVGDGRVRVGKSDESALLLYQVRRSDGGYVLRFLTYATAHEGMGTIHSPYAGGNERYYVGPGLLDEFRFPDADELLAFLHLPRQFPTLVEGSLHWSTDVEKSDLPAGPSP